MHRLKLFSPRASFGLAQAISDQLGVGCASLTEENFSDGELKIAPNEAVDGCRAVIVHSLFQGFGRSVHDRLCELLFLSATLRDLGASEVIAVTPYLCYSRSDDRKDPHDPVTLEYVARMFEAVGISKVLTLDVHNPSAFQNAFHCPVINLEGRKLFAQWFAGEASGNRPVVLSPDIGGIKRAERFRSELQDLLGVDIGSAFLEKFRYREGLLGSHLVGDVKDRDVIIYDDIISTGATAQRALEASKRSGARQVWILASHTLFTHGRETILESPFLQRLVTTDSQPWLLKEEWHLAQRVNILPCGSLFSEALRACISITE